MMHSPSWQMFYATAVLWALPALARFVEPVPASAEIAARSTLTTPSPTEPPRYRREEEVPSYTLTYASNSTCGFLSQSVQIPITCENKNRCLWELDYFRWIACEVDGETTGIVHTECVPRNEVYDSSFCDDACVSNTYNLLCTNETAPYCRTYAFPKGVRDYRCASTPATRISSVDFTYSGESYPDFSITTLRDKDAPSLGPTVTGTASAADSFTTGESMSGDKDGPLSVGAIVGIVIGSVALVLALLCYIVRRRLFVYCRRWWQKRKDSGGSNEQTTTYPDGSGLSGPRTIMGAFELDH